MTDKEYPEGHDRVISKGPCDKCGSRKGLVLYADGHSKCYGAGCDHFIPAQGGDGRVTEEHNAKAEGSQVLEPDQGSWPNDGLKLRRLHLDTMRKFGVFLGSFKGERLQVYPYYNQQGELSGQKLRTKTKDFPFLKNGDSYQQLGQCQLFGRHVFGDRFDRTVVITEGELDAMSVAQETDFKIAAVSVNSGAGSAAKVLKANYLWLDRFEEIILWFDDDEPGREATEECAKLFSVGKVRIAKHGEFKDASDCLQNNKPGDIKTTIYAATKWRPKGIVNAKERSSAVMAPREKVLAYAYPPQMPKLQEMTGGMHLGDVIYHVAGTGVGKSTALREIQYHAVEQGVKIAVLSFEDTLRDMMFGLMSIKENCRLHLIPVPEPEDAEALEAYDRRMLTVHGQVFGTGLVELFDPETAEWKMETIMSYVRYCAKALDCKIIFLDPLSFVAAGLDLSADERRVLDMVAAQFAKLAKELDVHLEISHHLKRTQGIPHEEGAPTSLNELRSSGGLANFAMGVIGWERNNQAADEAWRVTQSRVIKPIRKIGKTGIADVLYYEDNGRLVQSQIPFPPIGKPKEGSESEPFQPAGGADY